MKILPYRSTTVFAHDEEVQKEAGAKDDAREKQGRDQRSALPFDALERLIKTATVISPDRTGENVEQDSSLHQGSS